MGSPKKKRVVFEAPVDRMCVHCGCTDSQACLGGCSWLIKHKATHTGVCSNCIIKEADNPEKITEDEILQIIWALGFSSGAYFERKTEAAERLAMLHMNIAVKLSKMHEIPIPKTT